MFKTDIAATHCQPENFLSSADLRGTFEEFSRCASIMAACARCLDMRIFFSRYLHFSLSALSLSPPSSKIVLIITPGPTISAHFSLHRSAPLGSVMKQEPVERTLQIK